MVAHAGRRDHRGAEVLGELDPESRDTARAALDEIVRQFITMCLDDHGAVKLADPGRCLGMAEPVGLRGDDRCLNRQLFGVASLDPPDRSPRRPVRRPRDR